MTALTENRARFVRGTPRLGAITGASSEEFYEGQLVCSKDATGLVVVEGSATAGLIFAGVCTRRVSTGASNGLPVPFEFGHEEWFPGTFGATDVGKNAVLVDDNTIGGASVGPVPAADVAVKRAADGAANTATAETSIFRVPGLCQLAAAYFCPDAALTADAANNATITVSKYTSAGGAKTAVASLVTDVAGGDWTAWAPKALTVAAGGASIAAGSNVTYEITKGGTGVVVPAGTLVLVFRAAGTEIRVGEVKELETKSGTAGAWISVAVYAEETAS